MVGDEVVQVGGDRHPFRPPGLDDRHGPPVVLRTKERGQTADGADQD